LSPGQGVEEAEKWFWHQLDTFWHELASFWHELDAFWHQLASFWHQLPRMLAQVINNKQKTTTILLNVKDN